MDTRFGYSNTSMRTVAVAFVLMTASSRPSAAAPESVTLDLTACKHLIEHIGEPVSNKDERAGEYGTYCYPDYLVRRNHAAKIPDWVIERLTRDLVTGTNKRPHVDFRPEPAVPENARVDDDTTYLRSGYARGHQAASADFKSDKQLMINTFYFSNSVPQESSGFNSSIWSQFEGRVRDLAEERGEVYVITGPVYQNLAGKDIVVPESQNPCGREITLPALERKYVCGGVKGEGPTLECDEKDGVAIPAGLYKIIVDPSIGRVNAYLLPNIDHPSKSERGTSTEAYLKLWRVSVLNLEDRTGYTFLPEFDRHDRHAQKESCPATMVR